ncbi:hypothetical protein HDU86_002426 [Geranomyces michiganensis]|nr:hypothetical protein HDU86_002426 [Geranomyces michiganensis]
MDDSSLRKTLRNALRKAPRSLLRTFRQDDTLEELLREAMEGTSPSYQIATIKVSTAERALGLSFWAPMSQIRPWNPFTELDVTPVHLTAAYCIAQTAHSLYFGVKTAKVLRSDEMMSRLERVYTLSSEGFTRTFIDLVIIEALQHTPTADDCVPMKFYGEVSITSTRNNVTLSGFGDYVLAHGEDTQIPSLANITVLGKAISIHSLTSQSIVQALTYMGIVHRERQKANKHSARVFGYVTNFRVWIFLRINNDSSVNVSNWHGFSDAQGNIVALLAKVFYEARLQSPTTTPASSATALFPVVDIQSEISVIEREPDAHIDAESDDEREIET